MPSEETIPAFQERPTFSAWVGMLLVFVCFGLLVLVVLNASPRGSDYEQKRSQARTEKLHAMQAETTKALNGYSWVDKNKGVARIPIADAMKLTVAELANKKPVAANPIAIPAAAATPAPGASPAAAPAPASSVPASATGTATPKPTSVTGPHSEISTQPAAAANPPGAPPGTQPGASASPQAVPKK